MRHGELECNACYSVIFIGMIYELVGCLLSLVLNLSAMVRLCKFRFQQGVIKILYIFEKKLAFRVCGADHPTTALGSALLYGRNLEIK